MTLANDDWEGAAADWDTEPQRLQLRHAACGGTDGPAARSRRDARAEHRSVGREGHDHEQREQDVLDKQGNAWEPGQPGSATNIGGVYTVTQPLDIHSGAGQIDGSTLATQYLAGEMGPGSVDADRLGLEFARRQADSSTM